VGHPVHFPQLIRRRDWLGLQDVIRKRLQRRGQQLLAALQSRGPRENMSIFYSACGPQTPLPWLSAGNLVDGRASLGSGQAPKTSASRPWRALRWHQERADRLYFCLSDLADLNFGYDNGFCFDIGAEGTVHLCCAAAALTALTCLDDAGGPGTRPASLRSLKACNCGLGGARPTSPA
jgi:hypothetical protein